MNKVSDKLIVYTDGAYSTETGKCGYGIVYLDENHQFLDEEKGITILFNESFNVTGELEAVKTAIRRAIFWGYDQIEIYYDYTGISKWVSGEWRAKSRVSKAYVKFMDNHSKDIRWKLCKVPAHKGIPWNERADELAKEAVR